MVVASSAAVCSLIAPYMYSWTRIACWCSWLSYAEVPPDSSLQLALEEELTEMLGVLERREQLLEAEITQLEAPGLTGGCAPR